MSVAGGPSRYRCATGRNPFKVSEIFTVEARVRSEGCAGVDATCTFRMEAPGASRRFAWRVAQIRQPGPRVCASNSMHHEVATCHRHGTERPAACAARLTQQALPRWNCPAFSRPLPVRRVPRATQVDLDNIYAEVPDLYADGLLGVSFRNAMPEQDVNPTLGVGVTESMRTG